MNLLYYLSKNFWLLMKKLKVIYSKVAINDIDTVVDYIASIYRKESGLRYKNRIQNQLDSLANCAEALPKSHRKWIKAIHPEAKTMSIMNRRWTVVFHIEGKYVLVDRIIPSKIIKE